MMAAACGPACAESIAADKSSAVIYVYQHIGDDMGQSSIDLAKFTSHMRELKAGGYNVMPLAKIVAALRAGADLPPHTIGITLEGGFASTLENAIPVLREQELPFTLFFASDMADGGAGHMTWDQLRDLQNDQLATLGILPASYAHLTDMTVDQALASVNRAVARFREELGDDPMFIAYPYGEYSPALKKQIEIYGFQAGFGQQSGVAHAKSDFMALPRFTMTDSYGDLDRFMLTANALPLPVSDVVPEDMDVKQISAENPLMVGFTVASEISNISRLACFVSGVGKAELKRLGGNRIEMRIAEPFEDRSTRVNCTMPDDTVVAGQPPAWRWFGMQLINRSLAEDATDDTSTPDREQ